jgi:hypothetical protein
MARSKVQFCPKGHDTFVCGRNKSRQCKDCRKEYLAEYAQIYYLENKEELKIQHKQYNETHVEEIKNNFQEWYCNNKDKVIAQKREYESNKRKIDLNFRLKKNLRHRLYLAIRRNSKRGSAVKDLGCSIKFFKDYITSKFYGNMSWDNYGAYWELDHIVPLNKFDLSNREELLKAIHYTNFQPLTIEEHRCKSNEDIRVK